MTSRNVETRVVHLEARSRTGQLIDRYINYVAEERIAGRRQ